MVIPKHPAILGVGILAFILIAFVVIQENALWQLAHPNTANDESSGGSQLRIGDQTFRIEIADTQALRTKGLSDRETLAPVDGLLFIFEDPGDYGFWMKDMLFPIDIIWISSDYEIVDISTDVQPESFPEVFHASAPVQYVLETEVGFANAHGIALGDKVTIVR